MGRRVKNGLLILLVVVAAGVSLYLTGGNDGPPYAAFSTAEQGTGLFFDTLRHMGYPVRIGYAPLTSASNVNQVYVIIQPFSPGVCTDRANEMLNWVNRGGRLIFLHNNNPTVLDGLLENSRRQSIGEFTRYHVGLGQVVTGRANGVTNQRLLNESQNAAVLQSILTDWDTGRIWFVAYYHGIHPSDTFFSRLPMVVQLVTIQLGITLLILLFFLGKRFGKPIPAYEETERDENEYVHALARLYMKGRKKNVKKSDG